MTIEADSEDLREEHTEEAIAERLAQATQHSYLGDFVLGAIDGTVTTFAIVSGVAGAGLSTRVAIVLGLANVIADGFSMAVSNYLKTKSDHELVEKARRMEELHIEKHPAGEREEVRQIFRAKGFEGELLDRIIDTITENKDQWVDTMLTDELGLQLEPPSPLKAAYTTFAAFMLAGFIPIFPLFWAGVASANATYIASAIATALTFLFIGVFKGRVTHQSMTLSALETLLVGGAAAGMAFSVGLIFRGWT